MARVLFDLDVLQTFSTGMALGSFARAADRLGRSTSAVSAQLKKLEAQAGTPLLRKAGRGLELTEAGETLLRYARRLLELNDEAATALRGRDMAGHVRIGLQEDFGESLLPAVLGRFARAHPNVRVEACVTRSADLRERLERGQLDLAFAWDVDTRASGERVATLRVDQHLEVERGGRVPLAARRDRRPGEALPLVLLDAPCPLRELVVNALDRAGIAWRHAFSSSSLAALWAATGAGLGLAVRTPFGLPASVRPLDTAGTGLPRLPAMGLVLHHARPDPDAPAARIGALMVEAVRAHLGVPVVHEAADAMA